jgi:hypothetical protein
MIRHLKEAGLAVRIPPVIKAELPIESLSSVLAEEANGNALIS